MKRRFLVLLTILMLSVLQGLPVTVAAQGNRTERFPGKTWVKARSPEKVGWSSVKLQEAKAYSETIKTAAVMIVHNGIIVYEWGDTTKPYMCHSIRKSFLSALYGIHVAAGRIDLKKTMAELGINDNEPSLTETEKKATVADLLKARSGIYHPALYETAAMKKMRPPRGSHPPGTFWYYNNWDFNTLGAIFEHLTARSIFEEFENRIAKPLQMQDFVREKHTEYVTGPDSVYPAYPFQLSARDLARFGLLFARAGRWKDQQIIPQEWVTESTTSYSDAGEAGGYGYMWWVATGGKHLPGVEIPDGSFSARGAGGHYCLVIPKWDLVIVHRVDTFKPGESVSSLEFGTLVKKILEARPRHLQ